MFGLGPATRIYLAAGATDMRKGFEGLYGLARDRLSCDPLSGHVFCFANAQRNRLKLHPRSAIINLDSGPASPDSHWHSETAYGWIAGCT